jgi:ribosomal protein L12E/L44/L45/RPP1/RPP2
MTYKIEQLGGWIKSIRTHARLNYESSGWDYVVEAWEDADIYDVIKDAKNYGQALTRVGRAVKAMADHRAEIESTAF